MTHPQTTGRIDQRHPQTARPCGPTHHEGCACHEGRRDATWDRLQRQVDNLRAVLSIKGRDCLRSAAEVDRLRDQLTAQQRETLRAAQEAERYREALERISTAGCDRAVGPCYMHRPRDRKSWCPACIARRALGGEGE